MSGSFSNLIVLVRVKTVLELQLLGQVISVKCDLTFEFPHFVTGFLVFYLCT